MFLGTCFNTKTSFQYRDSHCKGNTIVRPSFRCGENSYTGKKGQFHYNGALVISGSHIRRFIPELRRRLCARNPPDRYGKFIFTRLSLHSICLEFAYQLAFPKPLTRPFVLKYVKLLGFANQAPLPHSRLPGESHMSEHPLFSPVVSQWLCNQMQSA